MLRCPSGDVPFGLSSTHQPSRRGPNGNTLRNPRSRRTFNKHIPHHIPTRTLQLPHGLPRGPRLGAEQVADERAVLRPLLSLALGRVAGEVGGDERGVRDDGHVVGDGVAPVATVVG